MLEPILVAGLVAAFLLAVLRPAWLVPALVVVLPLRLPIGGQVHLPTVFLLGAVAGRVPAIARLVARRPLLAAVLVSLPAWMLVSTFWARQPWFAVREAGTWLPLALAALLAAADEARDPRPLVVAFFLALLPSAAWALAEFVHLIPPLGDLADLRTRLLVVGDLVRGRALFYHPTRLAEFVEQIGLLLVACALCGPLRTLSGLGAMLAVAGTWASGSTAGLATMAGGGLLTASAILVGYANGWGFLGADSLQANGSLGGPTGRGPVASGPRGFRSRRRLALAVFAGATIAASGIATWLYRIHRGLGPRALVYRKAWRVIAREPMLGVGGGNWPFEVSVSPMERFWFASHTHSFVLQLWVEGGLVAVVLAAMTFTGPLLSAWRTLHAVPASWRGVVLGACVGVAGLMAHDLVHFFLRDPADGILTGILLGVAAGGGSRRDTRRQD